MVRGPDGVIFGTTCLLACGRPFLVFPPFVTCVPVLGGLVVVVVVDKLLLFCVRYLPFYILCTRFNGEMSFCFLSRDWTRCDAIRLAGLAGSWLRDVRPACGGPACLRGSPERAGGRGGDRVFLRLFGDALHFEINTREREADKKVGKGLGSSAANCPWEWKDSSGKNNLFVLGLVFAASSVVLTSLSPPRFPDPAFSFSQITMTCQDL